jgi:predicted small lipoprotein YifL
MKSIISIFIFVMLVICAYSCGTKGPLYMPPKPVASKPVASAINKSNESSVESSVKNSKLTESNTRESNNINTISGSTNK